MKIFEFILGPVNSWLQFDLTSELDARELSDRSLLPIAGVMAFVKMLGANDVLYGWDLVPGVEGADKLHPAHRATARMLTMAFAHEVADTSATHRGKLMTTLAWVPRIQGGPALFVSLGGGYQADVPIKSPWSFLAEASAAGGVSMMFGGPKKFQFQAPGGSSDARVALALEARPDPLTGTSLAFDIGAGTGVQFGLLRAEASWSAAGAQLKASLRNSAFTIAAGGLDGFLGRLLPDEGVRLPFDFAVGLASDRGAFIEGEVPFIGKVGTRGGVPARLGTRAPTTRAEPPPLPPLPHPQSNAPGLALRIPMGKSLGPITVHDFAFSLLREGNPDAPRFVAAVTTSVSAQASGRCWRAWRAWESSSPSACQPTRRKQACACFDLDFGLRRPTAWPSRSMPRASSAAVASCSTTGAASCTPARCSSRSRSASRCQGVRPARHPHARRQQGLLADRLHHRRGLPADPAGHGLHAAAASAACSAINRTLRRSGDARGPEEQHAGHAAVPEGPDPQRAGDHPQPRHHFPGPATAVTCSACWRRSAGRRRRW